MDEEMKQEFLRLLSRFAITGRPEGSLKDCLLKYTKAELKDVAIYYKITDEDLDDQRLVEELIPVIKEEFTKTLHKEDPDKMRQLIELQGKEIDTQYKESVFLVAKYLFCRYQGWLYFFMEQDSEYFYVVLPNELCEEAKAFFSDEEQVESVIRERNMQQTVKALVNIYGICEKEQFCKVWEENYGEKLEPGSLEQFFRDVSSETDLFEVKRDSLVIKGMPDEDAYEMIWELVKDQPYFMPDRADLARYENEGVDIQADYCVALEDYVWEKLDDQNAAGYMMFHLGICSAVDAGSESAIAIANDSGVEFEHILDVNEFCRLYCDFANHTPSWILRGFTPESLGCAQEFLSAAVPAGTKMKIKKIGRNDPCPCGSGKKYKYCCGK